MADQENNSQQAGTKDKKFWSMGPRDFIFKYLRFLPWTLVSLGTCLVLAYIKIRYSTPMYRVQSSLLIKNDRNSPGTGGDEKFDELFMSGGATTNLSNEMAILRSRLLMQRVVNNLNIQTYYYAEGNVKTSMIYPNAPFYLEVLSMADSSMSLNFKVTMLDSSKFLLNDDKNPIPFDQVITMAGNQFRFSRNPSGDINSFKGIKLLVGWDPLRQASERFIYSLKVAQVDEQSTIVTMVYEGENVKLGNDILNMIMAVYDSSIVEDKKKIQENTLKFINTQLYQLTDTLNGVQGRLRNFMVENQVFDIDEQSKSFLGGLEESSKNKEEQEVRVNVINWLLNYIGDRKNAFELVPTNLGIEEPALLQLMGDYNKLQLQREANLKTTPADNPLIVGMDNSLNKIRQNIYQALSNVKQSYLIAGTNIRKHEQELQGRVTALPGKSMHMINIQRRQKILEDLYSLLLQKKLETQIASASTISNSKVVEPSAGAGIVISPDSKKTYSLYFFMGLLIPIGIIAILEVLQDKVRGRVDVEKNTDTPILGEIGHSGTKQPLVVTQNSRRLISEQFRIVRTNLQYVVGKKEKPVIMITSSFSGEGKSFISTNMGAVMALSGKKTVIMEFDIRKPKIVSGLDLKRKMGITNYIIGKAKFSELLVKVDGVDNLYVIPCGPIPPNPAELLLDDRLNDLMREVMENFEVVIMDTAPIGLVSDATALSRFADCTLYIVRQGQTFRKQLGFIQELYSSRKLPNLSLIINDVKVDGSGYGGYYGSAYGYYGGYAYGAGSEYFEDERDNKNGKKRFKWVRNIWRRFFS